MPKLIIGTRASQLARWQTHWVAQRLTALNPGIEIVIQTITTKGDTQTDVPLPQIGDKGMFTREIEAALLAGQIHLAVHSLKDLPVESPVVIAPSGLTLTAITERADARDVLISRQSLRLDQLPHAARVGTSSLRRAAQLRAYRPDLQIINLRGNVDTRLRKAENAEYDAIVLAAAGILRLGYADRITEYLPFDVMLPAPGQGALAVQARTDDAATLALVRPLDHATTRAATTAERAFLCALGGGCQVPLAAYGEVNGETLRLRGLRASEDGTRVVRGEVNGSTRQPDLVGEALARQVLAEGSNAIRITSGRTAVGK